MSARSTAHAAASRRHVTRRLPRTFDRLRTTFVEGESPWTPVLVVALGIGLALTTFLCMLALAELAYHFG